MLGLARRAGKVLAGTEAVLAAIRNGKAQLVLLANDSSANTKKAVLGKAKHYKVIVRVFSTREELGQALGLTPRSAVAVSDQGFRDAILRAMGEQV